MHICFMSRAYSDALKKKLSSTMPNKPLFTATSLAIKITSCPLGYSGIFIVSYQASTATVLLPIDLTPGAKDPSS